jgi:hypothetical protein
LLLEQEPAQKGFLFAGDSENGARAGGVEDGLNHAASGENEYGFVAEAECSLRNQIDLAVGRAALAMVAILR